MEEVKLTDHSDLPTLNREIDSFIDQLIKRHSINKVEINNLALECMTAITASNSKSYELTEKSKIKYLVDNFNGKNKKLISDMNTSMATAQFAAQMTLQKLAESNLMSFEMISAVNYKLNNAIKYVNNEIRDIYCSMIALFKTSQNEIWEINTRLDKIERNLDLLNWLNSLEYRVYKGQEYSELNLHQKISLLTRDFFEITRSDIKPNDLLSLKSSLKSLNINPNDEISFIGYLNDLSADSDLLDILNGNNGSNNANQLPIAAYLSNIISFNTDKRYIIDQVITELNIHSVYMESEVLIQNLSKRYVNDHLQFDLTNHIKVFDLILLILLHLEQTNQTPIEVVEENEIELIEEENTDVIKNNEPSFLKVWDILNLTKIYAETEEYYYFFEDKNLFRINKISQIKEMIFIIQKHQRSMFDFYDNWNIKLLRDDYIVYRKDSTGYRDDDYKLCLYSIDQQSELVIYRSVRCFSFGVDSDTNTVYYFVNRDNEFIRNSMIDSGLFKYDVSKKIHKQVAQIKIELKDALLHFHHEDYFLENALCSFYDFDESPLPDEMFITVHQNKVLIEPAYTSMKAWSVLIKESDYIFYSLPEEVHFDMKENKKYRLIGVGISFNFKVNFNWDKEIYEVDFFPFEREKATDKFPIEVMHENSRFPLVIDINGISKCVYKSAINDSVYPMNVSEFMRKYGCYISRNVLKKIFPYIKETLILGRFTELNSFGPYIYTRNLVDNCKIYRYNVNNFDDIEIIES